MTVQKLIEILSGLDPDKEVVIDQEDIYETRYDMDFDKFAVVLKISNVVASTDLAMTYQQDSLVSVDLVAKRTNK